LSIFLNTDGNVEEPRSTLPGFSLGKEFVNYIARLDPAASSGDCGEHSVQVLQRMYKRRG